MASVEADEDGCDDLITTQLPEGSPLVASPGGESSGSRRYRPSASRLSQDNDDVLGEMEAGPLSTLSPKPRDHGRASEVFRVKQRLNKSESRSRGVAAKPKLGFDSEVQKFYSKIVHEPASSATAEPETLPYSKILSWTREFGKIGSKDGGFIAEPLVTAVSMRLLSLTEINVVNGTSCRGTTSDSREHV